MKTRRMTEVESLELAKLAETTLLAYASRSRRK